MPPKKIAFFADPLTRLFVDVGDIHASLPEFEEMIRVAEAAGQDVASLVPQVWLVPFCCSEVDPRPIPDGQEAFLEPAGVWTYRNVPTPAPVVVTPPSAQELRAEFVAKAQTALDMLARGWGYDSIFTACTYAEEPAVPQFQAEGQALRRYRSEFWAAAHALVPGTSDTIDTLLARLPDPPARPA
jgi:hypothetical protein